MKRSYGILFMAIFMCVFVSGLFAQGMMEKENKEMGSQMMSPMMGMMDTGMMGQMDMNQMPMMGHMMMGNGGMMCPMCGKMTPMMGMMNMGMMEQMADKLNLSKEQRDKAMALFIAHHKDMIRKKADLELAQVDMYELMSQENPDMGAIQKQIINMATMEGNMKFAQIKVWMDAKSMLTEEQKANLKKMMKEEKGEKTQMMGGKWMMKSKSEKSEKSDDKSDMKSDMK